MQMKPRNEEQRSRLWRIATIVSSLLIISIIIYFIFIVIVTNPLKGIWHEDVQGYFLEIETDNTASLKGEFGGDYLEIELQYVLSKSDKTVTFKADENAYADAVWEAGTQMAAGELKELVEPFLAAYNYSLENGELILTERDGGEQYRFTVTQE